jgi:hypothetical protein
MKKRPSSSSSDRVSVFPLLHLPLILVQLLTARFVVVVVAVVSVVVAAADDESRSVTIVNESGRRVEVRWIDPHGGGVPVLQSDPDLPHGASLELNSFAGHVFEVRELPSERTGACGAAGEGRTCGVDRFAVNSNREQVVFIRGGVIAEHTDSRTAATGSASGVIDGCKSAAVERLLLLAADDDDHDYPRSALSALEYLGACVEGGVVNEIERAREEVSFQAGIRTGMADLLEDYACADDALNTTIAMRTEIWDGRTVRVMLDRPAAKVHLVEDFVTREECDAVGARAEPLLHDALVADDRGGAELSETRRARQAGIKVDWEGEGAGDPVAILSRRVYDYVNRVLPTLNVDERGQEDLMSIQYRGRGPGDDRPPDRYMPHCDGDCDGLRFKTGERAATMVAYCEVPRAGGATRFKNANVHIRPKLYAATFFSYVDPGTMMTDNRLTEHSGCPVTEGEKKIVTQWIRLGVDDENPWDSYNSLGVKYTDAENQ